jgi:hypothetical protein
MAQLGTPGLAPTTRNSSRKLGQTARLAAFGACVTIGAALGGCKSSGSDSGQVEHCSVDTDCSGGKICGALATAGQAVAYCPLTNCTSSAGCGSGQVCAPMAEIKNLPSTSYPGCASVTSICTDSCQTAGCPSGHGCQSSGLCRLLKCNETDALACPSTFKCDPTLSAVEPSLGAGSITTDDLQAVLRGCIHKRCNETGGFVCRDLWTCQPSTSTDASGCVPIPCTTSGHCSDDISFICKPTSTKSRPSGTDPQGCVRRNCEEGLACHNLVGSVDVAYCDFSGPMAYSDGCASKLCLDSNGTCSTGYTCEAVSASTDARGCRPPACFSQNCPSGMVCSPFQSNADVNGCIPQAGVGGATGTGGASSTGIARTGGNGFGGATNGGVAGSSGVNAGGTGAGTGGMSATRVAGSSSIGTGGAGSTGIAGAGGNGSGGATKGGAGAGLGSGGSSTGSSSTIGAAGSSTTVLGICVDP